MVSAQAGYLPAFGAEGNTHPLAAIANPSDAVVRPPRTVVIPHVVVRSVVLVGVERKNLAAALRLHLI